MKIALLADLHLGFGASTSRERYEDAFIQAREAIELAADKADAILIAGDIFDTARPKLEVLSRSIDVFQPALERNIPIIAIHGNHDARVGSEENVVKLLSRFGVLKYIHREGTVIRSNEEEVFVYGVGWIPDAYAPQVFSLVPPPPKTPAILLFHQPLAGFFNWRDERPLDPAMLPKGYSLYVTGHLHWHVEKKLGTIHVAIPGSTIRTQLRDKEVEDTPAFFIWDSTTGTLEEVFLKTPRPGFLIKLDVTGLEFPEKTIETAIEKVIRSASRPPIVKVHLQGVSRVKINSRELEKKFRGRALVRIVDNTETELAKRLEAIRQAHREKAEQVGPNYVLNLLHEALREAGLEIENAEKVIERLAEGDIEGALNLLLQQEFKEKSKTPSSGILAWLQD